MSDELQVEVLDNELIRVSVTRDGHSVAAFVSSIHLAEDKRRQLEAHFERPCA